MIYSIHELFYMNPPYFHDRILLSMRLSYLFGSRVLTHVVFWLAYYLAFGFIWTKNGNYQDAFYLEFILLPVRISTVYLVLYTLIPRLLIPKKFVKFFGAYALTILLAGILQRFFTHFFYDTAQAFDLSVILDPNQVVRAMVLINSTAMFLTAVKIFRLYMTAEEQIKGLTLTQAEIPLRQIAIRSDKRTHKVNLSDIVYLEGLGNYVTYHLSNDKKIIAYSSLKSANEELGTSFLRIHKSYVINKDFIISYSRENVEIRPDFFLPVSPSYEGVL